MKIKAFLESKKARFLAASTPAMVALASIGSFASGNAATYTVKDVPTAQSMDLSQVGNLWQYAQSMLQDTLAIISNNPILIVLTLALKTSLAQVKLCERYCSAVCPVGC